MSTLVIKNLQVAVSTDEGMKQILKGVDLTINSGETHAIMGPNGSGKSTFINTMANLFLSGSLNDLKVVIPTCKRDRNSVL